MIGIIPADVNKWTALNIWDLKLEKGSTATAYNPAPEDASDYVNETLSLKIEETAKGIRQEITDTVKDAEGRITENYTNLVNETAQGFSREITAINEEIGGMKSTIEQTATNISLRIDELEGYENLVTGNSTGQGWARSNDSGVFEEVTPTSSGYFLYNSTQSSPKYLRTPLFNLKANTKYTLQFYHSVLPSGIKSASYGIKYGDSQTQLFGIVFKSGAFNYIAGTIKYTFTTGNTPIENAFVEFTHDGTSIANTSTSFYIKDVMVEIGEVAHPFVNDNAGLLSTGIDIFNKRIVFTADNIVFQNNKGQESMFIDENGQIKAQFINVGELKVRHIIAGNDDGQRVEIDPAIKAMEIYDVNNVLCSSFNGDAHPRGIADLYSDSEKGTIWMSNANSNGLSMLNGSLSLNGTDNGATNKCILYSDVWPSNGSPTNSPTSAIFNYGNVYCYVYSAGYTESKSNSGTDFKNTLNTMPDSLDKSYAMASVAIYLEIAEDINFKKIKEYRNVYYHSVGASASASMTDEGIYDNGCGDNGVWHKPAEDYTRGNTGLLKDKSAKATIAGYCRLRMEISMQAKMRGSTVSVKWGSSVTNGSNLSAEYKNEFYVSNFFANGFCLGIRNDKYIIAYKDSSDNMHFEIEEEGFGLKFSNGSFRLKHNGGIWMNMPLLVFKGILRWNSSTSKYTLSGNGYDGSYYTECTKLTDEKQGHVSIPLKSSWSALALSEYNAMIHLEGYGSTTMKGTVESISSTTLRVGISDDATLNDGNLMIEIWKI